MNNSQKVIEKILEKYRQLPIDFDMYVIADAKNITKTDSNQQILHADESEFFSREEFAEIASALYYVYGFVRVFYSETSFIKYILDNGISSTECIVYNFSRDGLYQGKKSLIPAFCALHNIKYTGCDAFVISLLRNKFIFSTILGFHNIPIPKTICYSKNDDLTFEMFEGLNDKEVVIKNICESASMNLTNNSKMKLNKNNFENFINEIQRFPSKQIIIQEYIDGEEYEVLVLQYKGIYYALTPVAIKFPPNVKFMNSDISNNNNYDFEILHDVTLMNNICKIAEKAAKLLGVKDYARFDFRVKNGIPYLFDIAGTPYTTYHSSIAYLFKHFNFKYEDIYKVIVTCMLSNYNESL